MNISHTIFALKKEQILTACSPLCNDDISMLKRDARAIADECGCRHNLHSGMLSGSHSRGTAHPYSDIDIEFYTSATESFQAFTHWQDRLVCFHVYPEYEITEEAENAYSAAWLKAQFRDCIVLSDESGFIRRTKRLLEKNSPPTQTHTREELSTKIAGNLNTFLSMLDGHETIRALAPLSRVIEDVSVLMQVSAQKTLLSEYSLSEIFSRAAGPSSTLQLIQEIGSQENINRWKKFSASFPSPKKDKTDPHLTASSEPASNKDLWEKDKTAFRRILEYRRKIYGIDDMSIPENRLFSLFCLGRIVENTTYVDSRYGKKIPAAPNQSSNTWYRAPIPDGIRQFREQGDFLLSHVIKNLEDVHSHGKKGNNFPFC